MLKLEDIHKDSHIQGIEPEEVVRVMSVEAIGDQAITLVYKTAQGRLGEQMLFRDDESRLSLAQAGRPWSFDAPGDLFKLTLEAYRIHLAHLFDPMMAVHTSNVEPFPHQISAVYESMLPRQPLRYVLADDPGAGKTIMAGLLIRELLMRADAQRILIVSPGSLSEQWQDELSEKFNVQFEIFSREKQEQCVTGNYFEEQNLLVARLDQLSRSEEYQALLKNTDWDLIVVDEAHKLSASYYGNKVNKTKRFQLGELLGRITRHFLLMTATPHNGKEADFQLFMSLLDSDRFYGKFREGVHQVDVSDLMRRMVKEDLLKFDGTPLFPERCAYTANYDLSDKEAQLYAQVTDYVREEMNRADRLDGKRKGTVGFALTLLQRRLASSPEAIYQSLQRRRKRLEARLEEVKLVERGHHLAETLKGYKANVPENWDDLEEEMTAEEYENFSDEVMDQATAAETIPELQAEIEILKDLENDAHSVVLSGSDRKWDELSALLQDRPEMKTASGHRRKLIIFTEHKDTLNYLHSRIVGLLGRPEAVCYIHGGVNRDKRRHAQEEFRNNPDVLVMLATDAAGEGVNLQNANLMVNYDLPWNPNRLEQRFGRIHRIGQTEVCHLWNMVANETREGQVFQKLFDKLEVERKALGGRVFDILGEAFENRSLKDLLVDAIRYGERPDVRDRLNQTIDGALDNTHLKAIMQRNALVDQHLGMDELYAVKEEMEKAEARKLQPYFIRSFFNEAFKHLDGELRQRESERYEIRHVPAMIRERDRVMGESRTPVLKKYERICFEKDKLRQYGKPMAELIHPAHPLMAACTDLILNTHRALLKQGAVMVDPNDDSITPKILFMIDHSVKESMGKQTVVSRRLQFVEIESQGEVRFGGWAPHLDLQPISATERASVQDVLNADWITHNLEALALRHASQQLVPSHYQEVKERRVRQADKIEAAVQERLVKEINYWYTQYAKLREDVDAGKKPRMPPEMARRRNEELAARLEQRKAELELMRNVVSSTPVVIGGTLVIPQGLLNQRQGKGHFSADAAARARIERIAMEAVTRAEEALGHQVKDVAAQKCGWDLTARPPLVDQKIPMDRHIEVKGRAAGFDTVTITRNEILYGLNQREQFLLALVLVHPDDSYEGPYYLKDPFQQEPDFGVTSVQYNIKQLLARAVSPQDSL